MAAGDVARDGKEKARAAGVEISRRIQTVEGTEHFFELILGNALTVIVHENVDAAALVAVGIADRGYPDVLCILACVVDDIGEAAFEGVAAERQGEIAVQIEPYIVSLAKAVVAHLLNEFAEVGLLGRLALMPARAFEIVVEHTLHLSDVGAEIGQFRTFAEHGELQFESREGRAEIVADAGEHGRALLDLALDARAHLHEGIGGPADFRRTLRTVVRYVAPHAEG